MNATMTCHVTRQLLVSLMPPFLPVRTPVCLLRRYCRLLTRHYYGWRCRCRHYFSAAIFERDVITPLRDAWRHYAPLLRNESAVIMVSPAYPHAEREPLILPTRRDITCPLVRQANIDRHVIFVRSPPHATPLFSPWFGYCHHATPSQFDGHAHHFERYGGDGWRT